MRTVSKGPLGRRGCWVPEKRVSLVSGHLSLKPQRRSCRVTEDSFCDTHASEITHQVGGRRFSILPEA